MSGTDCRICEELRDESSQLGFYQDELSIAYPARFQAPTNLHYSLLVTKAHVPSIELLPESLLEPFLSGVIDSSRIVARAANASGVTVRMNTGPPGQDVPHLHVHIVPRHLNDGHDGYLIDSLTPLSFDDRDAQASFMRNVARNNGFGTGIISGVGGVHEEQDACMLCDLLAEESPAALIFGGAAIAPSPRQRAGNEGEVIIFPLSHISSPAAASESTREALMRAVQESNRLLRVATGASGTTMRQHTGPPSQSFSHLAYTVTPRFTGDSFVSTPAKPLGIAEMRAQLEGLRSTVVELRLG